MLFLVVGIYPPRGRTRTILLPFPLSAIASRERGTERHSLPDDGVLPALVLGSSLEGDNLDTASVGGCGDANLHLLSR